MKRLVIVLMLVALLMVPTVEAGTEEPTLFISNPRDDLSGGACFDFVDTLGKLTYANARLAVWDRQDNPSFQTLADYGATLTGILDELDGQGYTSGTICVPEVLSDHCNKPGPMAIFFKLRVVVKPSRTTTKLTWMATCP